VAAIAAAELGSSWCDLDARVVQGAGQSIADIFADQGEAHFRDLERAALASVLAGPPQIVAAGAGWLAQPGNLAAAGSAVVLYLSVSPAVAARRLVGTTDRPLLAGDGLEDRLTALLAAREGHYARAAADIPAGNDPPETVAQAVVREARRLAGW
jgi:shikimate kinase